MDLADCSAGSGLAAARDSEASTAGAAEPPPADDTSLTPAGGVSEAAPKVKGASATRENAPAKTRDMTRIFKAIPADVDASCDPELLL